MAMFFFLFKAGVTQLARVTAFQAVGRGFESRLPLFLKEDEQRELDGDRLKKCRVWPIAVVGPENFASGVDYPT